MNPTARKPSGIPWISNIPEHWEDAKIKQAASMRTSNVNKIIDENEIPVLMCNYTDVYYNERITAKIDFRKGSAKKNEVDKFSLQAGDVIITKDSETPDDIAVPALVESSANGIVCGYHLAILRPIKPKIVGAFLFWLLKSKPIQVSFSLQAQGITRYGLSQRSINNISIPLPPLAEQQAIAAYLDRETARIDALIEKKQRLVALLDEKRAATISRTVTQGLDPNANRKPSGIPWIGDIPEHWEVRKLSWIFNLIGSGTTPTSGDTRYYGGEIPWVTTGELREAVIMDTQKKITDEALKTFSALQIFEKGTILIAMYGATIGRLGILGIKATTNQACCALSKPLGIDILFVYYHLMGFRSDIVNLASGGGQPNINQEKVKSLRIPLPPLAEQQAIAAYLDRETARIDVLRTKVLASIEKLREYRSALITAAVTGQVPVSGA